MKNLLGKLLDYTQAFRIILNGIVSVFREYNNGALLPSITIVRLAPKYQAYLCVQVRRACSAGVSPARVRIRSPVAWMTGIRETEYLKPIDKASILGCERVAGP